MWNMNRQINGTRKSKSQDWSIGNSVKVGFLTLRVKSFQPIGGIYSLESVDGKKQYEFVPHSGLSKLN